MYLDESFAWLIALAFFAVFIWYAVRLEQRFQHERDEDEWD